MLLARGKRYLERSLKFGCFLRFLPYRWNPKSGLFRPPATKLHMHTFQLHSCVMTCYTMYMCYRLMNASVKPIHFPLQQRLLSFLWTYAFILTSVGFFQLNLRRVDIMNFANRILSNDMLRNPEENTFKVEEMPRRDETWKLHKIERKDKKALTWHVYISLFLLYSNPGVHTLIQSDSPCAPHFISSSILNCRLISDNFHSIAEKVPFAFFELYAILMFLYICAFHWTFIMFGLTIVATELKKLRHVRMNLLTRIGTWTAILHEFRKMELVVILLNDMFLYYLMVFPSILFFIVALLIFGTVRLWHIQPEKNLMFPLCGMRCSFEAVSPLAMAGDVNRESHLVLGKWKELTQMAIQKNNGRGGRGMRMSQRSCRRIQCTAGSLYSFENSIVLCSINNCFQLALNLLVTFGDGH